MLQTNRVKQAMIDYIMNTSWGATDAVLICDRTLTRLNVRPIAVKTATFTDESTVPYISYSDILYKIHF